MTDRKIMEQALADLKIAEVYGNCNYGATELLGTRLAQPEQEPVAWLYEAGNDRTLHWYKPPLYGTPLYTAPPQREWVDLTPKEIEACRQKGYVNGGLNAPFDFDKAAGAVLAKAKEKNT